MCRTRPCLHTGKGSEVSEVSLFVAGLYLGVMEETGYTGLRCGLPLSPV